MYLKADVTMNTRGQFYARKGQQVEVVSTFGHVKIVERNGERFPVREDNLSETFIPEEKIKAKKK